MAGIQLSHGSLYSSERGLRPPRSDIRYWEKAIFQRSRRRANGRIVTTPEWRIQLQHQGRRGEFNLASANKAVAARAAREIDRHLRVNGWEATLSKYKSSSTREDHRFLERRTKRLALLAEELSKRPTNWNFPRRYWEIVRGIGCTVCAFNKWTTILQFHHIDGDRTNNALHNLTILCPNCHRALHQQVATISPPSLRELLPAEYALRTPILPPASIPAVSTFKTTNGNFISRPALANRWGVHVETLKRKERKGLLHAIYLSSRMIRYKLSEVLALEHEAAKGPETGPIPGRFVSTRLATPFQFPLPLPFPFQNGANTECR